MRHRARGKGERPTRLAELTIVMRPFTLDDPAHSERPTRLAELTIGTRPFTPGEPLQPGAPEAAV